MTVHWINDDYTRSSAALACRRMTGSHDYEAIAKAINSAMCDCGLKSSDVAAIVTDNASNFAKAFKEYAQQDQGLDSDSDDEGSNGADDINYSSIDLQQVAEAIDHDAEDMEDFYLPQQERCAAHLLNLVGSKDARVTDDLDKQYNSAYNAAFG